MNNIKHIIREVPPEETELSFYFDDDGLTEAGGDFCYNLFIIGDGRHVGSFNEKAYEKIQKQAEDILDGFYDVEHPNSGYCWTSYGSYKAVMEDFGIPYNSRRCHALKEWAKDADTSEPESIAAFLTITTGKKWDVTGVCGYCQGDYVDIVYCPEHYKSGVRNYGEVWLGCAREFGVIDLDENGDECDSCYGYIVADSEARDDEDYKRLVCEWACIDESETALEMFDGYMQTAKYRTA